MPGGDAESTVGGPSPRRPWVWADVAAAVAVLIAAQWAAASLPAANPLRLTLAMGVLFLAPGYLVLAASRPPRSRVRHLIFSAGLSPPTVALCALAAALVPNGFKAGTIMAFVTAAGVVLGVVAVVRRRLWSAPLAGSNPEGSDPGAPKGHARGHGTPDGARTKTL